VAGDFPRERREAIAEKGRGTAADFYIEKAVGAHSTRQPAHRSRAERSGKDRPEVVVLSSPQ
jgi:dihydroxyacetone kinase